MTAILGLNAFHGDAAACLLVDGEIVAAAEEERFRRVKHWAGVPIEAIRYCLEQAGADISDIDCIAVNRRPNAHLARRVAFVALRHPRLSLITQRLRARRGLAGLEEQVARAFDLDRRDVSRRLLNVEHHLCHLASAFLASPFERAAVVSVDGFGDFASAMRGEGQGTRIVPAGRVFFPHSLGMFYLAMTEYLGFPAYGDEYKVMGLAGHGEPSMMQAMSDVVAVDRKGEFRLNLAMFRHHAAGVSMTWDSGTPVLGRAYSDRLVDLLGPPRQPEDPLTDRHLALAASVQRRYEEAFFAYVRAALTRTGRRALCLAGGCAMNSLANGKLGQEAGVNALYIPSAPGDAGGAVGAALMAWHRDPSRPRVTPLNRADLGGQFSPAEIDRAIAARRHDLEAAAVSVERERSETALLDRVAGAIAAGRVVGWFHGRMEWGPRALGNRSILGDPRCPEMREILNLKIKLREPFRPFAPSVLREHAGDWFEGPGDVPFMAQVFPVRPSRRDRIPAVVHVDGTGRLQTVDRAVNPRYHALISRFHRSTGVPMVLNTSFNENEPIVHTPDEALDCFLRTGMDMLVLEDTVIERPSDAGANMD